MEKPNGKRVRIVWVTPDMKKLKRLAKYLTGKNYLF